MLLAVVVVMVEVRLAAAGDSVCFAFLAGGVTGW